MLCPLASCLVLTSTSSYKILPCELASQKTLSIRLGMSDTRVFFVRVSRQPHDMAHIFFLVVDPKLKCRAYICSACEGVSNLRIRKSFMD